MSENLCQRVGIVNGNENMKGKNVNKNSLIGQKIHRLMSATIAQMSYDEELVDDAC